MSTDPRLPDTPKDPAGKEPIVDTLTNILTQLTMINKRLDLQGEAIARHDQLTTPMALRRPQPHCPKMLRTVAPAVRQEALAAAVVTMVAMVRASCTSTPRITATSGTISATRSTNRSSIFHIMTARQIHCPGLTALSPIFEELVP
jgi:hypothetical protein